MRKKTAVMLAAMLMAGSLMTACGQSGTTATTAVETTAAAETTTAAETEAAKETETESVQETTQEASDTRTVIDSNGNEVEIPMEVTKVAPAIGAFAQVTEMLGQGKLAAATTAQISDYFKEVFTDYNETNPNNYDSTNVEDLIASGAQVVYGPASIFTDEQKEQLAQAGVAYVCINNLSDSESMMESFKLIGEIMGEDEAKRAEEFCEYYQSSIDDCQARTADIAESDRKQVLSLNVNGGSYTTVNKTDIFSSIVSEAGGVNVAYDYQVAASGGQGGNGQGQSQGNGNGQGQNVQGQNGQGSGQGQSSQGQNGQGSGNGQGGKASGGPQSGLSLDAEQIIIWNPDVIITSNKAGKEAIMADPALATVKAVADGNVYVRPQGIYMWGVRSGENAMMTPWLGTKLYPELFEDVDMEQIVIDFFNEWYHTEIDQEKAAEILEGK